MKQLDRIENQILKDKFWRIICFCLLAFITFLILVSLFLEIFYPESNTTTVDNTLDNDIKIQNEK